MLLNRSNNPTWKNSLKVHAPVQQFEIKMIVDVLYISIDVDSLTLLLVEREVGSTMGKVLQ